MFRHSSAYTNLSLTSIFLHPSRNEILKIKKHTPLNLEDTPV